MWWDVYTAFDEPETEQITVVCGSQMGKTEMQLNVIGHRFDDNPTPTLFIQPTEKAARTVSKDRLAAMFKTCDSLHKKLEKGQRDGVFEKYISGVLLSLGWAGSPAELASKPCGLVLLDERDRCGSDVGGEGDPVSLAKARTKNFLGRKIGVCSTPTVEGASPIWQLLDEGSCEFWAWHCIHCNNPFVPQISLLQWPDGKKIQDAANDARVVCPGCGGLHETKDKLTLNNGGRYIRFRKLEDSETVPEGAHVVLDHYVVDENPQPTRHRSFWVSGIASPWATLADIASELLNAYKSGDPGRIQAAINTYGGELWRVRGDAPDWEEVAANRKEYPPDKIPDRQVQMITLGADVQKYGIYYCVRAWGADSQSWLLDHDYLAGETEFDNVWIALGNVLQTPIGDKRINRAFIDSGYRPGDVHRRPDHAVYTFCRRFQGLAYPTKGVDSADQPFRFRDIDYSFGGKQIKNGVRLYTLNTDYYKRWIHSRIRWPVDAATGGWHLHAQTSEDYCRQMVAEELIIKASGKAVWVKTAKDNHYLDCEVGATAAASSLNVHKLRALSESPPEPKAQPQERQNAPTQGGGGYRRKELF
jgi:phage terminase large subunit GpA-like protein